MPAFQDPPYLSLGLAQQATVCPCTLGGGLRDDRETVILPGAWEPLQLLGGLPGHRAVRAACDWQDTEILHKPCGEIGGARELPTGE